MTSNLSAIFLPPREIPGEGEWPVDQFPDAAADRPGVAADATPAFDAGAAAWVARVAGLGAQGGPGRREGADVGGEGSR